MTSIKLWEIKNMHDRMAAIMKNPTSQGLTLVSGEGNESKGPDLAWVSPSLLSKASPHDLRNQVSPTVTRRYSAKMEIRKAHHLILPALTYSQY